MNSKNLFLLFFILIGLLFFLGCKKPVKIKIITVPENATVLINGEKLIGKTPMEYDWNYEPQTLVIQKDGFYIISQEINYNWLQMQYRQRKIQVLNEGDQEKWLLTLVYTLNKKN